MLNPSLLGQARRAGELLGPLPLPSLVATTPLLPLKDQNTLFLN